MAQRLETAAVISRAQRILFFAMLIAAVTMAAILIRMRERAQDRLHAVESSAPLVEPAGAPLAAVTLLIPNDADGSLAESQRSLALPHDDGARARVLLEALLDSFHDPRSTHPITPLPTTPSPGGANTPNIDEVFLMPVPQQNAGPGTATGAGQGAQQSPDKMAVVNFSAAFAQSHPSGIEPETLTLLAIIGTLHANFPNIAQVRFLVDGHQRDTLAGHADLTRVYLATDSAGGGK
jgi:hypothetical protein